MAHIQLINLTETKSPDGKIWTFPIAFPIIIKQLQKAGHTFNVLDAHLNKKTFQEILDFAGTCGSKIYGLSAYSHNYIPVKELAKKIRDTHPDAVIIVGGILAKNDDVLMNHTEVDMAATSPDGEFILVDILNAADSGLPWSEVKGITFKDRKTGKITKTAPRPPMSSEDYQKIGMPAYEYFDNEIKELVQNINTLDLPVKGFPLLTMRGCPFSCTFCGHLYGRKFLRKSWPLFFDELEYLIKRYNIPGFYSNDTNMFLNEAEIDEFCRLYDERKCSFKTLIELRTTFGSRPMFRKLYDHGVRVISFGLESGSQYMLDRMKKGFNLGQMKQILKDALDENLVIHGNFIFGTPGENKKTIGETRAFMLLLEKWIIEQKKRFEKEGKKCTSGYGWSVLVPSPTSELYDLARRNNIITDEAAYLEGLNKENAQKLVKGSKFKIALVQMGGNVNMSEFSSLEALLAYVKYSLALVKLKSLFYDKRINSANFRGFFEHCCSIFRHYSICSYCSIKDKFRKTTKPRLSEQPKAGEVKTT